MKKMNKKGYAYGSMVRKPMYGGGMAMSASPMMDRKDKMGMAGMAEGGRLKAVPAKNKGLSKLPKKVRKRMGYMAEGGEVKTSDFMDEARKILEGRKDRKYNKGEIRDLAEELKDQYVKRLSI